MRKFFVFVFIHFLWMTSLHADSYIKFKSTAKTPTETWTSGKMQRMEMELQKAGARTIINRADKGVSWTLNPQDKTYIEMQMALPYMPSGTRMDQDAGAGKKAPKDKAGCTADFQPLGKNRVIAGENTSGYRVGCKETPEKGVLVWMAALNPTNTKVLQDQKNFSSAYMKALFANYPASEKTAADQLTSFFDNAEQNLASGMACPTLPEGYPMAVESLAEKKGTKVIYEVQQLAAQPLDKSKFEVPAGYKKIESMNLSDIKIPEIGKTGAPPAQKDKSIDMKSIFKQIKKHAN